MKIDIQKLSKSLDVPVVGTVAIKGHGVQKLKDEVLNIAQAKTIPMIKYSDELERYIQRVEGILKLFNVKSNTNSRFLALKLIEEDPEIFEQIKSKVSDAKRFSQLLNEVLSDIEQKHEDSSIFVGDEKFKFIKKILRDTVEGSGKKSETFTNTMDKIFTHRIWGLPILFGIMYAVYTKHCPKRHFSVFSSRWGNWWSGFSIGVCS